VPSVLVYCIHFYILAFGWARTASTLLLGWQECHLACKNPEQQEEENQDGNRLVSVYVDKQLGYYRRTTWRAMSGQWNCRCSTGHVICY